MGLNEWLALIGALGGLEAIKMGNKLLCEQEN